MAHERTMPGPKATRTALRSVVGADVSPLMAFAPDADGALAELIDLAAQLPLSDEGTDPTGDSHTLRRIDGANTVRRFAEAFAAGHDLYGGRSPPLRVRPRVDRRASRLRARADGHRLRQRSGARRGRDAPGDSTWMRRPACWLSLALLRDHGIRSGGVGEPPARRQFRRSVWSPIKEPGCWNRPTPQPMPCPTMCPMPGAASRRRCSSM